MATKKFSRKTAVLSKTLDRAINALRVDEAHKGKKLRKSERENLMFHALQANPDRSLMGLSRLLSLALKKVNRPGVTWVTLKKYTTKKSAKASAPAWMKSVELQRTTEPNIRKEEEMAEKAHRTHSKRLSEGTVRMVSAATPAELKTLSLDVSHCTSIEFTHNGRTLLTMPITQSFRLKQKES